MARRMWLADACREYFNFSIGVSVAMAAACFVVAWLAGYTLFVPLMVLMVGPLLIAPAGCCGIVITWRMTLGLRYSARLRVGDFRFAGSTAPLIVWLSAAAGEYILHFPAGHAIAASLVWPMILTVATTVFSIQARQRQRD